MMTLTPAHGRDYKSRKSVLEAWNSGLDFIVNDVSSKWDGKPANKESMEGRQVKIRYSNLRKVMVIS